MWIPDVDTQCTLGKYRELFELAHVGPQGPFESMIRRKDGSVFPAEVVMSRFDVDDTPLLLSTLRDIRSAKTPKFGYVKVKNGSGSWPR